MKIVSSKTMNEQAEVYAVDCAREFSSMLVVKCRH